jgi:hypothetical protein
MPTPSQRYELYEGGRSGSLQEHRQSTDPVEREVSSSKEILDRVLSHESHTRTAVADAEDIVKWWNRTRALLDMYKPADRIMNYVAIGLAKLGIGQLLAEEQYQTLAQHFLAHKPEVDARIEFYLGGAGSQGKENPLTADVRRVKDEIRTFYTKVAPVAKRR